MAGFLTGRDMEGYGDKGKKGRKGKERKGKKRKGGPMWLAGSKLACEEGEKEAVLFMSAKWTRDCLERKLSCTWVKKGGGGGGGGERGGGVFAGG